MLDALCCIASLVKISNEFDHILMGYVQKTDQKQPLTYQKIRMSMNGWVGAQRKKLQKMPRN